MTRLVPAWIVGACLWAACAVTASVASAATFDTVVTLEVPQTARTISTQAAAVGDLNGDGRSDVVLFVASSSGFYEADEDYKIHLYEQDAAGVLPLARSLPASWGGSVRYLPDYLHLADLDADGLPEILLLSGSEIVVMGREADGDYLERNRIAIPSWIPFGSGITHVDDLDGDGHPDLVLHANGRIFYVLHGLGNLEFSPPTYNLSYGATLYGDMTVDDVDGDGRQDLVALRSGEPGALGIAWGDDSRHRFGEMRAIAFGEFAPQSAALGDIDRNGRPDIAYSYIEIEEATPGYLNFHHTIALHDVGPDRSIGPARSFRTGLDVGSRQSRDANLVAADVDGDGDTDLVSVQATGVEFLEWRNGSLRSLLMLKPARTSGYASGENLFVADLSGDGCLDIAVAQHFQFHVFPAASCTTTPASQPRNPHGSGQRTPVRPVMPGPVDPRGKSTRAR